MLRVEARNAETPIERKPEWIRTTAKMGPEYTQIHSMVKAEGLHTVCQEAGCPNIFECWEDKRGHLPHRWRHVHPALRLLRHRHGPPAGPRPRRAPPGRRVGRARWGFATPRSPGSPATTSPTAPPGLYAETIRQIHALNPNTGVEILPPDFGAVPELVGQVFDARPEVFAHNLETVPRIFKRIRPAFTYDKSLRVLRMARDAELVTKSNLILGMGEEDSEIEAAIADLHDAGCDILTITQYLRPSPKLHHPIDRWVKPEEFVHWSAVAEDLGLQGRHGRPPGARPPTAPGGSGRPR